MFVVVLDGFANRRCRATGGPAESPHIFGCATRYRRQLANANPKLTVRRVLPFVQAHLDRANGRSVQQKPGILKTWDANDNGKTNGSPGFCTHWSILRPTP